MLLPCNFVNLACPLGSCFPEVPCTKRLKEETGDNEGNWGKRGERGEVDQATLMALEKKGATQDIPQVAWDYM
jgi:hypothetical protein